MVRYYNEQKNDTPQIYCREETGRTSSSALSTTLGTVSNVYFTGLKIYDYIPVARLDLQGQIVTRYQ